MDIDGCTGRTDTERTATAKLCGRRQCSPKGTCQQRCCRKSVPQVAGDLEEWTASGREQQEKKDAVDGKWLRSRTDEWTWSKKTGRELVYMSFS